MRYLPEMSVGVFEVRRPQIPGAVGRLTDKLDPFGDQVCVHRVYILDKDDELRAGSLGTRSGYSLCRKQIPCAGEGQ